MINFQYNASEYEEKSFQLIPEGDHRIRIAEVVEQTSSSGKQMLKFTFDVSGYSSKLFYYLVFDPSNSKMTNQKIGDLYKCFDITNPNINMYPQYVGRVGACRVKHEDYNGEKTARVWYLLNKQAQAKLPAWKEPANSGSSDVNNGVYQPNQGPFVPEGYSAPPSQMSYGNAPF